MFICECEHICHFSDSNVTNHGKSTHTYGAKVSITKPLKTIYGTFNVCEQCANECLANYTNKS